MICMNCNLLLFKVEILQRFARCVEKFLFWFQENFLNFKKLANYLIFFNLLEKNDTFFEKKTYFKNITTN